MTVLPETALAFARECLNWTDCKPAKAMWPDSIMGYAPDDMFGSDGRIKTRFQYGNLDEVMDDVSKWCSAHSLFLSIGRGPDVKEFLVGIYDAQLNGSYNSTDLCKALMGACLQAARKLKEAA